MVKKILPFMIVLVTVTLLIAIFLTNSLPHHTPTTTAKQPPPEYPTRTRADALPSDVAKGTPENDQYPPIMYSDEWETPVPVPVPVNTVGGEDSAYVTWDCSDLYFFFTPDVRVPVEKQILDNVTGVYVSHRQQDGSWGEPTRVWLDDPGVLAMDGCEVIQGDFMWFVSVREGYTGLNHFNAWLVNGTWSDWSYVGGKFPAGYEVGEVHITPDLETLYFHSARNGTNGDYDIWVTHLVDGNWTEPENVAAVNSPVSEGWPFLTPDGEEMWITRWYMGTPALFRSKRVNGNWTEPELIVSQFAGEASLDRDGNLYFTHHYFNYGEMIEGDIYVAKRR